MRETRWHVIGRGFAGWHAAGVNVTSSGGDLDPRPWHAGGMTRGYLQDAIDGALVYDAAGADPDAFIDFVYSGPMVNPALDPAEVDTFSDRYTAGRMAPHLDGAFSTIATLATAPTYRGLDSVGVAVYRSLLEQVPGVKIGTVRNGAIVWDNPSLPADGVTI
jgi:hypothetical protein